MKKHIYALFAAQLLLASPAVADNAAIQSDTLLQLLQNELKFNMEALQSQPTPPYFMSYSVKENEAIAIDCERGLLNDTTIALPHRYMNAQIRVGNSQLDNFKDETQSAHSFANLSLDNRTTETIREDIWSTTLSTYTDARSKYNDALSRSQVKVADEDQSGCFSPSEAYTFYESPLTPQQRSIDIKEWVEKLRQVSAVFAPYPELIQAKAALTHEVERSWYVNTDGSAIVQNRVANRIMIQVSVKAKDGMLLPLMTDFFAYDVDSLPSIERMKEAAEDLLHRVLALRDAPLADPYTGPALLSGPASGVFFHEIFGHRLESHRLKKGGETFRKMVGQQVLPADMSVYCDPTMRRLGNQDLNGYYRYDDEGVQARRVQNVENGILREFLLSRTPLDGFPTSNGHGRAQVNSDPVSRQSNLVVETTRPYTEAQMHQMLIDEARRQGREFGYYFKSVTGGYTQTEGLNVFNVTPLEVFRVFVDGRPDQLVRGVELIGTPLVMFSNIQAAGDKTVTFTGFCGAESGWIPVSASSPMIYVSQIETQRRDNTYDELEPLMPAPSTTAQTDGLSRDSLIFRAMRDEIRRSLDSLQLPEAPILPFYLGYEFETNHIVNVLACLGGICGENIAPNQFVGSVNLGLGDYERNSLGTTSTFYGTAELDYNRLRNEMWRATDRAYRQTIMEYAERMMSLTERPLTAAKAALFDMQPLPARHFTQQRTPEAEAARNIPLATYKRIASLLSAIFLDYPELKQTSVSIEGYIDDRYSLTSEDIMLHYPIDHANLKVRASVRTEAGDDLSKEADIEFLNLAQLVEQVGSEDAAILSSQTAQVIRDFASNLIATAHAPVLNDYYYRGPYMIEGTATGLKLWNALDDYLIAGRNEYMHISSMFGQRIITPNLSIHNYTHKSSYQGQPLFGDYEVDNDGVEPAEALTLIDHGFLRQQLNDRKPKLKLPETTGSSRLLDPMGMASILPGTLHFQASKTLAQNKMKQKLMRLAAQMGHTVTYLERQSPWSNLRLLYQVDVKTGAETLVRAGGINIDVVHDLNRVDYFSTEEIVNNYLGKISLIHPNSLILENIEIKGIDPSPEPEDPIPHP